jgi:hypothetical protein
MICVYIDMVIGRYDREAVDAVDFTTFRHLVYLVRLEYASAPEKSLHSGG